MIVCGFIANILTITNHWVYNYFVDNEFLTKKCRNNNSVYNFNSNDCNLISIRCFNGRMRFRIEAKANLCEINFLKFITSISAYNGLFFLILALFRIVNHINTWLKYKKIQSAFIL